MCLNNFICICGYVSLSCKIDPEGYVVNFDIYKCFSINYN